MKCSMEEKGMNKRDKNNVCTNNLEVRMKWLCDRLYVHCRCWQTIIELTPMYLNTKHSTPGRIVTE
jgi:hypothetical protein